MHQLLSIINAINNIRCYFYFIAVTGLVLLGNMPVSAQQTVFNVPSAEITPKGKIFLQHESQFRPYKPRQFWLGTHYGALGVGHNTEITVTLFDVASPPTNTIDLGAGFKSVIPILKKRFPNQEFKLIGGSELVFGLQGGDLGNWTYVEASGRLPKLRTRLTGGFNYGTKHIFGKETHGFIGAIEQPVTKKFSIIADWYSGDSAYGLLIPGFAYQATDTLAIFAGYQIPNPSNKLLPSGFVIEIAKFLP